VCHEYNGLSLLDVSDPTNPILLDHIKVMYAAFEVSFKGDEVVISSEDFTHILSIDENQKFQTKGTIWQGGWGHNVLSGGEIAIRVYDTSNFNGELIIYSSPCSFPTAVPDPMYASGGAISIYPNPFNPHTTINFDLEKTGVIDLRVYDLTGRLVRELVAGEYVAAGPQSWAWNGRDAKGRVVSSGVYLVQLQGDGFEASGRMALIR
jgi:hypothetical protein